MARLLKAFLWLQLCLLLASSCNAVTLKVQNTCSFDASVAMAFSTQFTNTCTFVAQPDPTSLPICTSYWFNAPAGQTTTLIQGLDTGCVYFTAHSVDDLYYVWPTQPTCDGSLCLHDLSFNSCTAQYLGPTSGCYAWYAAPPDGVCLYGNQEFTWQLLCAASPSPSPSPPLSYNSTTTSPTPNASPDPGNSPTPSPTPTPVPKTTKSGMSTGAIVGIACGAVVIASKARKIFI